MTTPLSSTSWPPFTSSGFRLNSGDHGGTGRVHPQRHQQIRQRGGLQACRGLYAESGNIPQGQNYFQAIKTLETAALWDPSNQAIAEKLAGARREMDSASTPRCWTATSVSPRSISTAAIMWPAANTGRAYLNWTSPIRRPGSTWKNRSAAQPQRNGTD